MKRILLLAVAIMELNLFCGFAEDSREKIYSSNLKKTAKIEIDNDYIIIRSEYYYENNSFIFIDKELDEFLQIKKVSGCYYTFGGGSRTNVSAKKYFLGEIDTICYIDDPLLSNTIYPHECFLTIDCKCKIDCNEFLDFKLLTYKEIDKKILKILKTNWPINKKCFFLKISIRNKEKFNVYKIRKAQADFEKSQIQKKEDELYLQTFFKISEFKTEKQYRQFRKRIGRENVNLFARREDCVPLKKGDIFPVWHLIYFYSSNHFELHDMQISNNNYFYLGRINGGLNTQTLYLVSDKPMKVREIDSVFRIYYPHFYLKNDDFVEYIGDAEYLDNYQPSKAPMFKFVTETSLINRNFYDKIDRRVDEILGLDD